MESRQDVRWDSSSSGEETLGSIIQSKEMAHLCHLSNESDGGCPSKLGLLLQVPQTGRLKQQKFILSQSWRLEPKIKVWAGFFPPEASLLGV